MIRIFDKRFEEVFIGFTSILVKKIFKLLKANPASIWVPPLLWVGYEVISAKQSMKWMRL